MPIHVYSARLRRDLEDPDLLDVTRLTGKVGLFLAPSWEILNPAIMARRTAKVEASLGRTGRAERIEREAWETYVPLYRAEMSRSFDRNWAQLDELLARPRVVLACYCEDREHCHTTLLRRELLPPFGAVDCGELPAPEKRQRELF